MTTIRTVLAIGALVLAMITVASADPVNLLTDLASVNANDTVNWAQLGPDHTFVPIDTFAKSGLGNKVQIQTVAGAFTTVECPATPCNWSGGFTPGETALKFDSPIIDLFFTNPVGSAGLYVQERQAEAFKTPLTASVQAIFTDGSVSAASSVNSDAAGDPVFIGLSDIAGNGIAGIGYFLEDTVHPWDINAVSTLYINNAIDTPEPSPIVPLGGLLVLLSVCGRRRLLAPRNGTAESGSPSDRGMAAQRNVFSQFPDRGRPQPAWAGGHSDGLLEHHHRGGLCSSPAPGYSRAFSTAAQSREKGHESIILTQLQPSANIFIVILGCIPEASH